MKAIYKYRVYPTIPQEKKLSKLFGCRRVVYNDALACCNSFYKQNKKKPSSAELQKLFITQAKKMPERAWLSEVAVAPLQQSIRDLDQAYQNFYNSITGKRKGPKVNPPRFKKRQSAQSARFTRYGFKLYESRSKVHLAKIGDIKIRLSRPIPSEPSSATIIKDAANRYFISFVVETSAEPLPKTNKEVGIDLGITTFATLSTGEKRLSPRPLRKYQKKLARLQRKFSRSQKGSNRREKLRLKIARLHARIKDIRLDFQHKLSTELTKKYDSITLENLKPSNMMRNHKLAKHIADAAWRLFRTLIEGKCAKYDRELTVISEWEPTSQKCSVCGFRGGKKKLDVREWKCINCGAVHDRDINAAINILNTGSKTKALESQPVINTKVSLENDNVVQLDLFSKDTSDKPKSGKQQRRTRRRSASKKLASGSDKVSTSEFFKQLSLFS